MTELTTFDLSVLQQIGTGKAAARPGRVLAQRLGLKDTRQIRLSIIQLIEHGEVIIGDAQHGYYKATTTDEGAEACERLMHYLKSTGYHYKILKQAVQKKLSGQLTLVR